MKSMNIRLRVIEPVFAVLLLLTFHAKGAPERVPQLDSLAVHIVRLERVPMWGELSVLAAGSGWAGMLDDVQVLDTESEVIQAITCGSFSGTFLYGMAESGSRTVLVTAPYPKCLPAGFTPWTLSDSSAVFRLTGLDNLRNPAMAYSTPGMEVFDLFPDSDGTCTFPLEETGIYWIEVMETGDNGPEVALLFPFLSGGEPSDVFDGTMPLSWSEASSTEEILKELNDLREREGAPPLTRNGELDSVASVRASQLALSGRYDHFTPDSTSLTGILPEGILSYGENIGRGLGFQEAWSMIMISPFHLRTCLSPTFSSVGIAGAIDSERFQWQIVLVQIFADGEGYR